MAKLKVGIIGCGGIANGKHLPALKRLNETLELVAFCDIIEEKATKAAKEYGTEDAKVFENYKDLLKLDLDAVHVLTPNSSHSPITIAALESGKHVMCEKPMAINSAEAKKMLDAAKKSGKKLTIGYQNRFRSDSLYLKKLCEDGELGEVYYARALAIRRRAVPTWGVFLDEEKQGGGPLIDIGTHALDLTLWMMDNYEPAMVVGTKYRELADTKDAANSWGPWDPKKFTVEDSAFGFIRMKNGATIALESSWALNTLFVHEAQTMLSGTKGGADMLGEGENNLRINGEKNSRMYTFTPEMKVGGAAFFDGEKAPGPADLECRAWYDHIIDDKPLTTKPEQAYVVTQILEAIYDSAKSGKPVYF
ncbi:oxidoreductase [Clostridia bacterium]|nr:oxidoreductase [Clostridia bacterium]